MILSPVTRPAGSPGPARLQSDGTGPPVLWGLGPLPARPGTSRPGPWMPRGLVGSVCSPRRDAAGPEPLAGVCLLCVDLSCPRRRFPSPFYFATDLVVRVHVSTCPGRLNTVKCTFCVCGNDHVAFSLVCKFGNTLISPASDGTRTPLVPWGCFLFVLSRMVCTHMGLECSVLAGVWGSHGAGFLQHAGTSRVGLVAFLKWPVFTREPVSIQ